MGTFVWVELFFLVGGILVRGGVERGRGRGRRE